MPRKLKVFRTPIGFHDAYVAAPSQKAALEAWGADVDLFARGGAELVEDAALAREPLAHPGQVIRRARGSTEEHLAALASAPRQVTKKRGKPAEDRATRTNPAPKRRPDKPRPKPKPRPSRTRLDKAETAIGDAEARHARAEEELRERERAIDRDRRALHKAQDVERARLARAEERARAQYDAAMQRWRES